MMNAASATSACPACRHPITTISERIGIAQLAEKWSRNWPMRPMPGVAEIAGWLREDLANDQASFRQCSVCGLEFADPMRSWSAGHYPAQSHGLGFDHAQALQWLSEQPAMDVLEIGCGRGEFLQAASHLGHRCIGIDFSQESVSHARMSGVDARVMDLAQLATLTDRPTKFHVVAMFQVIEHLDHPDGLFSDLSSLVGEGARLLAGCPAPNRITRKVMHAQRVGDGEFWDYPPQHVLRWTPQALTSFLSRHGWMVESVSAEPLSITAAAAELVAIDGMAAGWYENALQRRFATLLRRIQLSALSLTQTCTGTRLFVRACRQD